MLKHFSICYSYICRQMLPSYKGSKDGGVLNPISVEYEKDSAPTALTIPCDREIGDDTDDRYELVTDPTLREFNNTLSMFELNNKI